MQLIAAGVPIGSLIELAASTPRERSRGRQRWSCSIITSANASSRRSETEAAERRLLALFNELMTRADPRSPHFQRTLLRAAREHIEKK